MRWSVGHRCCWFATLAALALAGCGTTRWTDTKRTATEQMLVSDAIDRAVSRIDFRILAGKEIFLDTAYLNSEVVDKDYLASTMRQQMVASGCILKDKRESAEFIVEARAGTIGTDRHDLLYGMPATPLPTFNPVPSAPVLPNGLPEVALAKRTDQQAVAKIAVFAYHRETGAAVWQSGAGIVVSKARDLWFLGAGPFQKGTIYEHTQFAGNTFHVPLVDSDDSTPTNSPLRVSQQKVFNWPQAFPQKKTDTAVAKADEASLSAKSSSAVQPAAFNQPLPAESSWEPLQLPTAVPR